MGVTYKIPHQARFIPTVTTFKADFNVPTVGKYNFDVLANQNIEVIPLIGNTVYLIDRLSLSADISELSYQNAVENNPPLITFKRKIQKEIVYQKDYPVLNYIDDQDFTAWIHSEKGGDVLTVSIKGIIAQTNDLIGVDAIRLFLNLSIYAIDSNTFQEYYKKGNHEIVGRI